MAKNHRPDHQYVSTFLRLLDESLSKIIMRIAPEVEIS